MSSVYAPECIGYTMLMRPQKTETAVQSYLIPARVIRFCACARWWPHHGAGVMPLWHLSFLVFLWVHWTLQNTGTNRDHFRLNQLSQMENNTSLFTLAVTTSCPWYVHRINRLHECFSLEWCAVSRHNRCLLGVCSTTRETHEER